MEEKIKTLLLEAVKTTGSYDPDVSLAYIQEQLTTNEYGMVRNFLSYVHENDLHFGKANVNGLWDDFFADHPKLAEKPAENPTVVLTPAKETKQSLPLPKTWTKETEQSFLERLFWLFKGTDTYLVELFSEPMLADLQQRISSDFPVDLYGDLVHANEEITRLDQENGKLETTTKEQKEALDLVANAVKHVEDERDEAKAWQVSLENKISGLETQIEDLGVELGVKDFQIIELKAKLYDIEHPKQ